MSQKYGIQIYDTNLKETFTVENPPMEHNEALAVMNFAAQHPNLDPCDFPYKIDG